VLRGRDSECAQLDRLLDAVRAGHSAALVVRGEPGIGKTALLEHAGECAEGCRVIRAVGVESEMELPFAGLQLLCAPLLDGLERLPAPQRDALGTAVGLSAGGRADRFLIGLAVLSLLADAAEQQPLVCLVDDAQWLDQSSAQTLAFVARRLEAESVVLLFAEREPRERDELAGLPELQVRGISDASARELLASMLSGPLDERVADQIVAETRGNPLALLELLRGLSPAEVAGGFGLAAAASLPGRIEERFRQRVEQLPPGSQRLLLVAAAEPIGDPALLSRAAGQLGVTMEAAGPAEAAGLLSLGARVSFRHPLLRSAIYRAAFPEERQRVHRALAEATDAETDPDRHAWHRAHATLAPDEDVAAELELSADRARARGGVAAAAAFLEGAARLTPEPARRAQRALRAAQAKHEAGAPDDALKLVATAEMGPLDELQRARLERLRAEVAFARRRGNDAPPLLLAAAKRLEPLDATLARETYLEALSAAIIAGRLAGNHGVVEVARAARAGPRPSQPLRSLDLLLDGLATRFTDGYAAGVPPLRQALLALRAADGHTRDELRWLRLACRVAPDLWDDETWFDLATRDVRLAREAGALAILPIALAFESGVHVHAGDFAAATAVTDEAEAITEATGIVPLLYASLLLLAWQGREADTLESIRAGLQDAVDRGEGRAIGLAELATAVLYNGLGRYDAALAAATRACEHDDLGYFAWSLTELVEAASRSGEAEVAASTLEHLAERTGLSDSDWARGIEARSRALLSEGQAAEDLYLEAIERLARSLIKVHLARAHLLYGEWLRRENRRLDAREQLRTAHELFVTMGAEAFAERAARELLATGERARKRTPDTRDQLTAQERQIAVLASEGYSNPEIGAQLYISPRTVEYHLHKVYSKLAISSRNQLESVLPAEAREAQRV
jgi:DNA-binding CsgD family transcriptional regulator